MKFCPSARFAATPLCSRSARVRRASPCAGGAGAACAGGAGAACGAAAATTVAPPSPPPPPPVSLASTLPPLAALMLGGGLLLRDGGDGGAGPRATACSNKTKTSAAEGRVGTGGGCAVPAAGLEREDPADDGAGPRPLVEAGANRSDGGSAAAVAAAARGSSRRLLRGACLSSCCTSIMPASKDGLSQLKMGPLHGRTAKGRARRMGAPGFVNQSRRPPPPRKKKMLAARAAAVAAPAAAELGRRPLVAAVATARAAARGAKCVRPLHTPSSRRRAPNPAAAAAAAASGSGSYGPTLDDDSSTVAVPVRHSGPPQPPRPFISPAEKRPASFLPRR